MSVPVKTCRAFPAVVLLGATWLISCHASQPARRPDGGQGKRRSVGARPEATTLDALRTIAVPVQKDSIERRYAPAFLKSVIEERHARRGPVPAARTSRRVVVTGAGSRTRTYAVELDLAEQVIGLTLFSRQQPELHPSLKGVGASPVEGGTTNLLSASLLALKAKQFDDGLYAAIDLFTHRRSTGSPQASKLAFLRQALGALLAADGGSDRKGAAMIAAALELSGETPELPASLRAAAEAERTRFLADPLAAKPLGFYTWSTELQGIFQTDRMLQAPLEAASARGLASALTANRELGAAYAKWLALHQQLTSAFARPDLRPAMANPPRETSEPPALFPASRSHETDLALRLGLGSGVDLAPELLRRVRRGDLDLKPGPASGYNDHQAWALEALAAPERMAEARHLRLSDAYREALGELFKALLGLSRETHVKQLAMPKSARPPGPELVIAPQLTVEPLATYYLRRAASYRFVRQALVRILGHEDLMTISRWTAAGPVNLPLLQELTLMERLFLGAYLRACDELGMACRSPEGASGGGQARALFGAWAARLTDDPDLGQDVRMMVPVSLDPRRGKIRVWMVLGLEQKALRASFEKPPAVRAVLDAAGKPISAERPSVTFEGFTAPVIYLATAEVEVTRLMDREAFRAHCDRYRTREAVLQHLR